MKCNARGVELIKRHEGLRLEAYRDAVGVLTIGWGHTGDVREGMKITAHQADAILDVDLHLAAQHVSELFPGAGENEAAALISLAFNVGGENLDLSRLRKKFLAGDKQGAADEFPRWCHAGGKVLPELVRRRAEERELFLTPVAEESVA